MVKQDCQYFGLECPQVHSVRQTLLTTQCCRLHSYRTLNQVLQGKARQGKASISLHFHWTNPKTNSKAISIAG